jgi:hypothetical protein
MLGSAKDLPEPKIEPEFEWDPADIGGSIRQLKEFVVGRAKDAITYYQFAKKPKKRWAIWLRMAALVFAGLAGLLPILSQILTDAAGVPVIAPGWASVYLALAAGSVAIDRFFGFSSAWMRFMASELRVRRATDEFELDWEAARAGWPAAGPGTGEADEFMQRARAFTVQIADIVREETEEWISEFRETIRQIDESARTTRTADERGAINVTVSNGDTVAGGWQLSVDDGPARACRGTSAAVGSVKPGVHTVQVEAAQDGRQLYAERVVHVERGEITEIGLTLA